MGMKQHVKGSEEERAWVSSLSVKAAVTQRDPGRSRRREGSQFAPSTVALKPRPRPSRILFCVPEDVLLFH